MRLNRSNKAAPERLFHNVVNSPLRSDGGWLGSGGSLIVRGALTLESH
jgi:hypothetical protein